MLISDNDLRELTEKYNDKDGVIERITKDYCIINNDTARKIETLYNVFPSLFDSFTKKELHHLNIDL